MQLRRKALALVVGLLAVLASTSAFASIPRSEVLDPAISRAAFDLASPSRPEEVLPLVEHLHGALDRALPSSEPLAFLAETRIRASEVFAPFEQQRESELNRALHQAYAELSGESASDESFCGSDPVNCSDPLGAFGENAVEQQLMYWFAEKYATDEGFRNNVDDVTYAVGETLANPYVQGTLQLVGGCSEAIGGASVIWTGAGTVPGAVLLAHGGDICVAGARTILTGKVHESYFDQGSMYVLQKAGMSEQNARLATGVANIGVGASAAIGSVRALRDASRVAANRARVLANIAESRAARQASRFSEFAAIDRELTPFRQYLRLAETLDVSTSPNKAVFYSGPGNRALAEAFANATGRTTLELTPGGAWLDAERLFTTRPLTKAEARTVWARLSERYAAGASGEVTAFTRGASPTGIFESVELPTLRAGRRVSRYVYRGWRF